MSIIFDSMNKRGHEEVVFCHEQDTGLKAIIAIHNTTIGPALGGCRMWNYPTEEEALTDVLRLSRGMSYKAAIAGLNLGGGKAVIIGNAKTDKTETGRYKALSGGKRPSWQYVASWISPYIRDAGY